MKTSEIVTTAVRDLSGKLKQIKDSDEDDLEKLSGSFYEVAKRADRAGSVLERADSALSDTDEDEQQSEQDEQQSDTEQSDEQQTTRTKRKQRGNDDEDDGA